MDNKETIWRDYLGIGLLASVIISLLDYSRDGYLHIALVITFLFIAGLKDSLYILLSFIRKYTVFFVLVMILTIYFRFFSRTEPLSDKFALSAFLLVFFGYIIGLMNDGNNEIYSLMWKALMVLGVAALFHHAQVFQNGERMSMAFQNPVLEADAMIAFLLISILYIDNMRQKIAGIALSSVCIVLTSVRVCMIMAFFIILFFLLLHRDIIKKRILQTDCKRRRLLLGVVIICILLLIFIYKDSCFKILILTTSRFGALFRVLKGDFSLGNDYSIGTRVLAIREILRLYPKGSIIELLLGRGQLHGYYAIKNSMAELTGINAASEYAGPIENTFLSILYDYGLCSFILYAIVFIKVIISAIVDKNGSVRKAAIFSMCIIILSLFVDMEYWMNLSFVLFSGIGIYLGIKDKCKYGCVQM
ncbi:O-antigen ligase family protein [Butyrivibrio sp. AC2005]|uniref:O-antigen ligase family protein n=1 Tax=Butyrivibrio sp. AC2005 TaxID=1280672 RepID=UPI00042853EA|nr:O-antigen ligase family protein [Butyrivibrio sp. AC2005]